MSLLERKLRRDVARRRWQVIAIVVTISLGVGLFGASYDAYRNLLASYAELFDRTSMAALTVEGGDSDAIAASLSDQPGVEAVATRSTADLPVRVGDQRFVGRLVGMPVGDRPSVNDVLVLDGEYLAAGDSTGVLVERHMADHFELRAGNEIEVRIGEDWQPMRVSGVAASPEYIWPARSRQEVLTLPDDFGVLFVPQSLLDGLRPAQVTRQVMATYSGPADDAALTSRLEALAREEGARDAFTLAEQPSNAILQEDISGFGELSLLFPLLFLTAAALATYVLVGRMVLAQRPQIGLLLAVGFRRRRVFAHYLGFGIVTGLVGSVIGAVLGVGLAGIVTTTYTAAIAIPITVVEVRPLTMIAGIAFGIFAGGLAAVVPAWRASRVSPAAAMSGAVATGRGGRSLAERLVPALRRLPARWKMIVRGIGRSPVRSVSTVVGVMIAVTLVLVSWGMLDTTQILLDRQFNQAERTDAVALLATTAGPDEIGALRAVDGVAAAEPLAQVGVTIENDGKRYSTSLAAYPDDTSMHRFLTSDGTTSLPSSGILVGTSLREQLDLAPGDGVMLSLAASDQAVDAQVAGFVDEPLGTYAYASLDELSRLMGADGAAAATVAANLRFEPDADREAVLDRLSETEGVIAVTDARGLQRAADSLMGLFYAFVAIMLVLGAVMAFAVLFNLMSANIGERVTELASLRASGMAGSQLARIVTAENVLLTLAGILPGLLVGYLGAAEFMASFSSDLFRFDLHIRPTTFVLTAAGVLVAALISQLPILAAVRRIDIAQVVRERAT